ncbi:MAG TPA: TlpA disulfide reductase family protein [Chitinophagaceae bacterium]|nr:TlpA disulfide reductase family protein [Chitinophagaceae bacterium]
MVRRIWMVVLLVLLAAGFCTAQDIPRIRTRDLQKMLQRDDAVYVINFWATWCQPCRDELPHLVQIADLYRDSGVKVILISLDYANAYPAGIRQFLNMEGIRIPVYWLDETNPRAIAAAAFPAWKGLIPFTIFLNRKKGYEHIIEQEIPGDQWVAELRKAR